MVWLIIREAGKETDQPHRAHGPGVADAQLDYREGQGLCLPLIGNVKYIRVP